MFGHGNDEFLLDKEVVAQEEHEIGRLAFHGRVFKGLEVDSCSIEIVGNQTRRH